VDTQAAILKAQQAEAAQKAAATHLQPQLSPLKFRTVNAADLRSMGGTPICYLLQRHQQHCLCRTSISLKCDSTLTVSRLRGGGVAAGDATKFCEMCGGMIKDGQRAVMGGLVADSSIRHRGMLLDVA